MIPGFQCFFDANGNIHVTDGVVMQPTTGVVKLVGSGGTFRGNPPDMGGGFYTTAPHASGSTFVGGSGRNLQASGLPAPTSGAASPRGWFVPTIADNWRNDIFLLVVTGSSAATIHDGTNTVAILSTGGTAPAGAYASTTYGATTYNSGTPFTLTVALEIAGGGVIPGVAVSINFGTALGGVYNNVSAGNYQSATDANWTLVVDVSGSAELRHSGTAMATRATGVGWDPRGAYDATTAGKAAYNLTANEPVDGEDWRAFVEIAGRLPRAGFVYVEIVESGGVLTAVNGPFFDTTMPTAFSETHYLPLSRCDGSQIEQYVTGAILLPGTM